MPNPGRKDERPVVGPADDATRKRMLAQALGESDPGTYSKPLNAQPADPESNAPSASEPTLMNAASALKNRGKQIDQAVSDATG